MNDATGNLALNDVREGTPQLVTIREGRLEADAAEPPRRAAEAADVIAVDRAFGVDEDRPAPRRASQ